jgi:LysR family transcriptional regulator, glycine cleavage system transcriptional activator
VDQAIKTVYTSFMTALPPLAAIRVFESVARHGNFSRAAAELNMTQSAVSYQIKLLESFVGAPLFVRQARGVVLSEKGETVAPTVRRALGDLAQSFRLVREESNSVLVISTMQTIAGNWLAPRLGGFQLLHPEYTVRLDISPNMVDLESEGVDVVIRSGKGIWPGLTSHFLLGQNFTPVCSPHYTAREGRPEKPADILNHVLIARNDIWWPIWFEAAGLPRNAAITRSSVDVDTQQMAATLAIAGSGIALVSPAFVGDDLKSGRLMKLFDIVAYSGADYYLAYPESRRNSPKTRAFRDWILKEAGVV